VRERIGDCELRIANFGKNPEQDSPNSQFAIPNPQSPLSPAIFLDRDGTVSEEVGYIFHSGLYKPFPWTGEAVRRINESGMKAILITNQSGVGRGYFKESSVHEVHDILTGELARFHAHLDGIYFCPHRPDDDCDCRKPKPGMLLRASREMNIDLGGSFMIGDRYVDVTAAHAAGMRSVLVCSGDGRSEIAKYSTAPGPQPHAIAKNLLHAVEAILSGQVL
jgi:D-glycero-D-manno-heptose 1,7-bisphosphate phosphatase